MSQEIKLTTNLLLQLIPLLAMTLTCHAFYKAHLHKKIRTVTPSTPQDLKEALCDNMQNGQCRDQEPRRIIINKLFDLTNTEGTMQELGCYHSTSPTHCLKVGQLKLNVANQCDGLTPTTVSYNVAGRTGLDVGSNKIIIGQNGGGITGKGLKLKKSYNVEIRNLRITDINAQVIWGGDAIDLINVKNVLIDGNYIKNIGRQMVVTHFGSSTGVLISNNVFDGNTPFGPFCNGAHYWLWLFLGHGDQIALQNNVILKTSGRGPHLVSTGDSTTLLHMIQNTFYDVSDLGLIDVGDPNSSVLVEGNIFVNIKEIVHCNHGNIYMPQTATDINACERPLGRKCLMNTVVNSGGAKPNNSPKVLQDFQKVKDLMVKPISMKKCMTNLIKIPLYVSKHMK